MSLIQELKSYKHQVKPKKVASEWERHHIEATLLAGISINTGLHPKTILQIMKMKENNNEHN